jgi:hypothetical protein
VLNEVRTKKKPQKILEKRKWRKNLPPVSLIPVATFTPVATLPPVSLILVVHLDLRISPRIFEKNLNGLKEILWGWGETDL